MATDPSEPMESPDIGEVIRARGDEFLIAYDIPRLWSTGFQAFLDEDHGTFIFREQSLVRGDNGLRGVVRNVSSIIMPLAVVREMHTILTRELERVDGNAGE